MADKAAGTASQKSAVATIPGKKPERFHQRYRTWFGAGSFIILLFLILALFLVLLKLQFSVSENLVISVVPEPSSLFLEAGKQESVNISVTASNPIFCTASCSYELEDMSDAINLEQGTFSFSGMLIRRINHTFSVPRAGTGQNLYNFKVSCLNEKSFLCKSSDLEKTATSLITLNYDLTAAQKEQRDALKPELEELLRDFNTTDFNLQELNDKFFILSSPINLQELVPLKNSLNEHYSRVRLQVEDLTLLWYNQSYTELADALAKVKAEHENITYEWMQLELALEEQAARHNLLVTGINQLSSDDYAPFLGINYIAQDNEYFGVMRKLQELLSAAAQEMVQHGIQNYSKVEDLVNQSTGIAEYASLLSLRNFNTFASQGNYFADFASDMLCQAKNICSNHSTVQELMIDRAVNPGEITIGCARLRKLETNYAQENNKSSFFVQYNLLGYNQQQLNETLERAFQNIKASVLNRYAGLYAGLFAGLFAGDVTDTTTASYAAAALKQLIPQAALQIPVLANPLNLSHDTIAAAMHLEFPPGIIAYEQAYCNRSFAYAQQNFSLYRPQPASLELVIFTSNFTPIAKINVTITDVPPLCCVFAHCNRCCSSEECAKDSRLYPIIFLHGHAFNRENSAEYSLDAFNKLSAQLEKKGYLNAGVVTPLSQYDEFRKGEWGLPGKPVMVKGSYYYTSYFNLGQNIIVSQNSENIETYAIRLKELIELVTYRTGKDKVIIVAHSMGGLVARSYLQVFGDESVYKLVLIATPNYGVLGSVNDYCPVLGERKECEDMSAAGIFMKRLNSGRIPLYTKIYTIDGVGCSMGTTTGDGIVTSESAALPYAKNYNVTGSCSSLLGGDLHTDILDIDKYNATLDYLQLILGEEAR